MGLRQLEGIDLAESKAGTMSACKTASRRCAEQGMLELNGTRLRLAPDRLTISNEVFVELLGAGSGACIAPRTSEKQPAHCGFAQRHGHAADGSDACGHGGG